VCHLAGCTSVNTLTAAELLGIMPNTVMYWDFHDNVSYGYDFDTAKHHDNIAAVQAMDAFYARWQKEIDK